MLKVPHQNLPSSTELPDSDDTPVDNEDQNFLPNVLLFLLEYIWQDRDDWFFGVDMGIYHTTGANPRIPVVPDGFLSLGVERRKGSQSRSSYVTWEEQDVVPALVIEIVSQTYGKEYDQKLEIYRRLGVPYYVLYNPHFYQRDRHLPLEIYKLTNGKYELQNLNVSGEPLWMPEIGLGIGRCVLPTDRFQREVLSWFNVVGDRYLSSAEAAQRELELLRARMRSQGLDPDAENF
ncbi:MAG: Uma2 family endonuclease [Coleofasciculaceae cyanobacterium SM2_1_6]|nr:Uma2 family endonuclease [Coleofasciculaceae cyanobacterium SM2_1_6]